MLPGRSIPGALTMRMRSIISLSALLLPGVAFSDGHTLSIRPFVSYVDSPDDFGMRPSAAYGGVLELHTGDRSTVYLNVSSASARSPADAIDGTQTVPISVLRIHAGFLYRLFQPISWFGLGASLSGGLARFSTPDHTISLGALGSRRVGGAGDTRMSVAVSVVSDVRLGGSVSLVLEPGASIITPLSADHLSYFVSGGIRIGLF